MSISPVSSVLAASTYTASSSSGTSTSTATLKRLEKQIEQQIRAEEASHDDAATKAQKIASLEAQLATVDAELASRSTSGASA